ncbi:MAG: class I adenylate-forming enzyme family protein [Desertimonas sp.]
MTNRLVALDLPGGPAFVATLRRVWDDGDAVLPIDQRLPTPARRALLGAMAPDAIIGPDGTEHRRAKGRPTQPGDALVVATSGSTGEPKGVVLTHDALRASARATNARIGATTSDHWLACLPLAHIGGLSVVVRALHAGQSLTVLAGFDADAVNRSGATLVSLVGTALARIEPRRFRTIVIGGSQPPADLPPNVVTTYGMTESGSGVVYDGVPLDGVEIRVADDGEIHVRGAMLLRAYRDGRDPKIDGWYRTGDIGRWLPDGRLHVDGRAGDMIVTGGEKVWPEPVEAVLRRVVGVADVVVTGRPDPTWGQAVTALVVPDPSGPPTLDALRAAVKRQLAPYCAPRAFVLVEAIPRSTLGKPKRAELRRHVAPRPSFEP